MCAGIHTTGGEYIYIKLTYRATVGLRCNRCERGFITATRGMGGDWMRNEATPLLTHFLSYCQWPCKYFKILFTSVDFQSTFFISLAYKYTFETIFDHILSGLKKVKLRRVIKKLTVSTLGHDRKQMWKCWPIFSLNFNSLILETHLILLW